MTDSHLCILDSAIVGVLDHQHLFGDFGHTAAFAADQRHGVKTMGFCPFHRFHTIGGIAADADSHGNIPCSAIILKLAGKNVGVGVIVSERSHPAYVVVERNHAESFADFVGGAFAQVGG